MRSHAAIEHHQRADLGLVAMSMLLALPALFAFLGSAGLAHGAPYFNSGMWFFYLVSRNLGMIGVVVAAWMTGRAIYIRTVSDAVAALMAGSIITAVVLLLCAARTLPDLW